MASKPQWDIFCAVVDNFGDIGVCWRLARQLAAEHQIQVRLWVDDLLRFSELAPSLDPHQAAQTLAGVEVRHWTQPFIPTQVAQVVIEAFACALPEPYLQAMAEQDPKPCWINLEYLSAEDWVTQHHGLPSPHPQLPLTKHFFFPGFVPNTGGVLREADLLAQRDAFQSDLEDQAGWWHTLGLKPPAGALTVSLFAYPTAPIHALLKTWADSAQPIYCVVPDTAIALAAARALGRTALGAGTGVQQGRLTLSVIPFLSHGDYDRLLWACDMNFVRGEDSLVRALWAAKPLVWQPYPQEDAAHFVKMEAFLALFQSVTHHPQTQIGPFWQAWSGRGDIAKTWTEFASNRLDLARSARTWGQVQAGLPDLATNLVQFCKKQL